MDRRDPRRARAPYARCLAGGEESGTRRAVAWARKASPRAIRRVASARRGNRSGARATVDARFRGSRQPWRHMVGLATRALLRPHGRGDVADCRRGRGARRDTPPGGDVPGAPARCSTRRRAETRPVACYAVGADEARAERLGRPSGSRKRSSFSPQSWTRVRALGSPGGRGATERARGVVAPSKYAIDKIATDAALAGHKEAGVRPGRVQLRAPVARRRVLDPVRAIRIRRPCAGSITGGDTARFLDEAARRCGAFCGRRSDRAARARCFGAIAKPCPPALTGRIPSGDKLPGSFPGSQELAPRVPHRRAAFHGVQAQTA